MEDLTETGNNTVTYADAFFNADLVYVLNNWALKEYIILKNRSASNAFSFLFTMDGLTLQTTEDGAYFADKSGTQLFAFDSLFAIDANGVMTEELSYSFVPVKDTGDMLVTVTLDNNYLQAAERAFPVVIDPTIMISSSNTADACVCSGYPTTNYQMATQLRTGYDSDYGVRRTYIKFDIPASIPAYSVTEATLDIEKLSGVAPTMRAYRCLSQWSSGSINWNNKPGYTAVNLSSESVPYRPGSAWYTMDVTYLVQDWVNGSYTNYGFVVRDRNETDPNYWTTFYSSDASSPHKPELHIIYNENGGFPTEPTEPPGSPEPELPSVNLILLYDAAYMNRYTGAYNRIRAQAEALKQYYYDEFQINVSISNPMSYRSYADISGPNEETVICQDSILTEDGMLSLQEHHYTNIYNNLFRIPPPVGTNSVKMVYIGHDICRNVLLVGHRYNSSGDNPLFGLACESRNVMTITDTRGSNQESVTAIHEFGHMFGIEDHYASSVGSASIYSDYCIYGIRKEEIQQVEDVVICSGCRSIFVENINKYTD